MPVKMTKNQIQDLYFQYFDVEYRSAVKSVSRRIKFIAKFGKHKYDVVYVASNEWRKQKETQPILRGK